MNTADEKDARIAALEQENAKLREKLRVMENTEYERKKRAKESRELAAFKRAQKQ